MGMLDVSVCLVVAVSALGQGGEFESTYDATSFVAVAFGMCPGETGGGHARWCVSLAPSFRARPARPVLVSQHP